MPFKRASTIVGPPADALADALESVAADDLQVIAEYDAQSYQLLHVADDVAEQHGGLDGVEDQADSLFDYYHIDFLERDLLADMLWLGEVGTFVTFLDHGIVVRAHTDSAAVFVALDVTASVDDVQITIENTLHEPDR
ncbi:hypothetical protein SAMN05216559_0392 [Halomicrobium zhouii]|uniref:Roadblock/LAMTOR2 domain-containing protein n=1 Tax=Halomicrobium zhouii TaxID=767519 RepID=A0A1I6K916_9EURY|nr:hypothetical protein [Halomicrobium zhouii]SFR87696.1 hypothetical protein SAMN05216559_0392 [Halomicrobium zhouii]